MESASSLRGAVIVAALALAVCPAGAYADETPSAQASSAGRELACAVVAGSCSNASYKDAALVDSLETLTDSFGIGSGTVVSTRAISSPGYVAGAMAAVADEADGASDSEQADEGVDKLLDYDRKDIERIGTQESTGHTICCPSFSCAYADAVLDGTVHDHDYYTCSCCTWPDWGGGDSSYRCVGTDEELLREAYDQIKAGKPTVIHVAGSSGEHWIALIGYERAEDPDHLSLGNFIALDPWDGAKINAAERYSLYGDGCEHISDR